LASPRSTAPHENVPRELVELWTPRLGIQCDYDPDDGTCRASITADMSDINLKAKTVEQWCHWASLQIWNAQAAAQNFEHESMRPPTFHNCRLTFSKNDIGDLGANTLLRWTRDMQMQIDCLDLANCSVSDNGL